MKNNIVCALCLFCGVASAAPAEVDQALMDECIFNDNEQACERWEVLDPIGYDKAFPYQMRLYEPSALAQLWGIEPQRANHISIYEPFLLFENAVDSVGGWDPFSVNFANVDEFNQDVTLTEGQKWKWLRYRRAEIANCFEGEGFNEMLGVCEAIEELVK